MLDQTAAEPEVPRPRREPMFNIPRVVLGVLIVLGAVHSLRQWLPEDWDDKLLLHLAFVPGSVTFAFDPDRVVSGLRMLAMQSDAGLRQAQLGRYILEEGGTQPWTLVTYGLLHADWTHIGVNSLWLLAFGTPLARRLGAWRFIVFLCATSVAGALAHYVTHPTDLQPVIGASASVSGCMGAALRFMFQPALPATAILGMADRGGIEPRAMPVMSYRAMLRDRRVVTFLIVWFLTNFVFGIASLPLGLTSGAVAWEAHIGGFLLGIVALPLFDRPRRRPPAAADDVPPPDDPA